MFFVVVAAADVMIAGRRFHTFVLAWFVTFAQVNRANHEFRVSPRRRRDQAGLAAPRSTRLG